MNLLGESKCPDPLTQLRNARIQKIRDGLRFCRDNDGALLKPDARVHCASVSGDSWTRCSSSRSLSRRTTDVGARSPRHAQRSLRPPLLPVPPLGRAAGVVVARLHEPSPPRVGLRARPAILAAGGGRDARGRAVRQRPEAIPDLPRAPASRGALGLVLPEQCGRDVPRGRVGEVQRGLEDPADGVPGGAVLSGPPASADSSSGDRGVPGLLWLQGRTLCPFDGRSAHGARSTRVVL